MKRTTSIALFALISLTLIVSSCTQNERAKAWGGTAKIDLPAGTKFVTATWKGSELWYSTRPARPGESPETTTFSESSSWGLVQGSVIFTEK